MIKILELFGGIGSPRIALRNIGIPVKSIDYVEIDLKAVKSYNAMFKGEMRNEPQSVIGWNLKPDILIHGSPCQDFSIAGMQKGADHGTETKSSLMWETIRIIQHMGSWKPRFVIWENVKGVLSKHMIHNFNRYLSEMQKMGYSNSFETLDARDFGLPQARQRVFTISSVDGIPFDFDELIKIPMKNVKEFLGEYGPEHIVTQPSVLKAIGLKGIARATVIEDYAYTITTRQDRTPAQIIQVSDDKYRYLTELECWRLQGYLDQDYANALSAHPGTLGDMNRALYKQAGNSIPVTIFESIFRKMLLGEIKEVEEKQLKIGGMR